MALFSPNAKLYSLVPLSSQWPSIVKVKSELTLKNLDCLSRVSFASDDNSDES